jgi:acyl-coenzyme A thioesterase PaaI-like protein
MTINTHLEINEDLCGRVTEMLPGRCTVEFNPMPQMRADDRGLVHGGFIFGAADYAAMLAVNDPHVVLARAEVQFMKPTRVGERLVFKAAATPGDHPRRSSVEVHALDANGEEVFRGVFSCAIPTRHVLDGPP